MRKRQQNTLATSWLSYIIALGLPSGLSADTTDNFRRVETGKQAYWVEQLADGLNHPTSMVWLPNGNMLISEPTGHLRILRNFEVGGTTVSGVPSGYSDRHNGLKDVLLDPDFHTNQLLYLLLAEGTLEARHAAVYRGRYCAGELHDVVRIFRTKDDIGGKALFVTRMMLLSDKTLLLAVGDDRHSDRPQKLSSHMGKILRINRDGSTPRDNPFLRSGDALPEIWSYGHRMPLGLFQDTDSGDIWEVEAGERGGDELNLLKSGSNYGWAAASWGFSYSNRGSATPYQSSPGIEDPILVWMPSVTPSGFVRYRGKVYTSWDGDYFVGHLTGRSVERLKIERGRVLLQERILTDLEERIRDVKVGPDNYIYILTDHQNGRLPPAAAQTPPPVAT